MRHQYGPRGVQDDRRPPTLLPQEFVKAYLPPGVFDYYSLLAVPLSFPVAGLFGLLLGATLIRFLYGRPLEAMLATC